LSICVPDNPLEGREGLRWRGIVTVSARVLNKPTSKKLLIR
jgi:hypothetical protein